MQSSVLLLTEDTPKYDQVKDLLDGYQVIHCHSLDQAEQVCGRQEILLVLVSDMVGQARGDKLFRRIRERYPLIAGLLLTDKVDGLALERALDGGICGLVVLPCDSQRLRAQVDRALEGAMLRKENSRLRTLLPLWRLAEKFLSSTRQQEVLDSLLDEVVKQTGANNVSVMLHDQRDNCLRITAARGLDRDLIATIRLQPGEQIAGWVFQQRRPVILNRSSQEESPFAPLLKRPEIVSAISFPLMVRSKILGVLNISRTASDQNFSEADIELLTIICGQASLALENITFFEMTRKTARTQALFEQYVAPEVASLLLESESDVSGLGTVGDYTVLFADIRNFTSLVQHLQLEDLRRFLNEFFQLFTDVIFQHRGTIDKFMGDAVLAVFGAPVKLNNPCLAAVRTAREIRSNFRRLRVEWAGLHEGFRTVDLGIAVTAGQMYFGNVGSPRRLDYTVIGTPVNLAQRLAAESSKCQIYVNDLVAGQLGDEVAAVSLGPLRLRGLEERVEIFRID